MEHIINEWLQKLVALPQGDEIFLPCETKAIQKSLYKQYSKAIENYKNRVDGIVGSKLYVTTAFRDGKLWIILKKLATSPTVGFIKTSEGKIDRTSINIPDEKIRRIKLMIADNMTIEEIEEIEGKLSDEELRIFNLSA